MGGQTQKAWKIKINKIRRKREALWFIKNREVKEFKALLVQNFSRGQGKSLVFPSGQLYRQGHQKNSINLLKNSYRLNKKKSRNIKFHGEKIVGIQIG
ncbi:MAG: hypothetical protein HY787_16765 [Deltaproteobacteria bacterium]|nr:hypothetical protein [Deltaproteobacteria bacterium]